MKMGKLDVLNPGKGHLEINFNKEDPADVAKAKDIIEGLLKRNALIVVHDGDECKKVTAFDPSKNVYIVHETEGTPKEYPVATTHATSVAPVSGG